jgi:hypothetical protein
MFEEITGKRFDELTLIILSKKVTVKVRTKREGKKHSMMSGGGKKLSFLAPPKILINLFPNQ